MLRRTPSGLTVTDVHGNRVRLGADGTASFRANGPLWKENEPIEAVLDLTALADALADAYRRRTPALIRCAPGVTVRKDADRSGMLAVDEGRGLVVGVFLTGADLRGLRGWMRAVTGAC